MIVQYERLRKSMVYRQEQLEIKMGETLVAIKKLGQLEKRLKKENDAEKRYIRRVLTE